MGDKISVSFSRGAFPAFKRKLFDMLLQRASLIALMIPSSFLLYTLLNIFITGYQALYKTEILVRLDTQCMQSGISACALKELRKIDPSLIERDMHSIFALKDLNGTSIDSNHNLPLLSTVEVWVSASSEIDSITKDRSRCNAYNAKKCELLQGLELLERIRFVFNVNVLTKADSSDPLEAGVLGVTIGSFMTILVCLFVAFPIGVLGGICLEEFMPRNTLTKSVRIIINNLNATPAIIFGIIGLTFYLDFLHIPRSSPLAGGLTLAMIMVPMLIITTSQSVRTMPSTIKEAALALGASKMQILFHHTFPYCIPYVATNVILGLARIIGESAPLLLIGMVSFVADAPSNILEPATVFPTQIYIWATNPESGFKAITSVTIVILLIIMLIFNILASMFRKRFAHKPHFD